MASEVEQFVGQCLSPDKATRENAENAITQLKIERPEVYVQTMLPLLGKQAAPQIRAFAAVLLRRAFIHSDEVSSTYYQISPQLQASVKAEILNLIHQEEEKAMFNKLCDLLGSLGSAILADRSGNSWPELLPTLFEWTKSDRPLLRQGALDTFSHLTLSLQHEMKAHLPALRDVLAAGLADSMGPVRLAAVNATSSFLLVPQQKQEVEIFKPLIPQLLRTISDAMQAQQEEAAQKALEGLIEVVLVQPTFIRHCLSDVLTGMYSIASLESLDIKTRQLALEFLVTLADIAPNMVRRRADYVQQTFQIATKMMLDLRDDPKWGYEPPEGDDLDNANFGAQSLDRLPQGMGGKALLPVAMPVVQQFLQHAEWQYRHTALITVSQIVEGCAKLIGIEQQRALVQMIVPFIEDQHPRVRWAAVNALGQMSTDFAPKFEETFHAEVIPALTRAMGDQFPLTMEHAATSSINFTEAAKSETIAPYVGGLLQALLALLRTNIVRVQEQAITAISSLADTAGSRFAPYYNELMPLLLNIVHNALAKEQRGIRAKALECITLTGLAVGRDLFLPQSQEVLQTLVALSKEQYANDDVMVTYVPQAFCRVCSILNEMFVPYLDYVITPLLEGAQREVEIRVQDVDQDPSHLEGLSTIILDDKRIGIKTSALEEKLTCVKLLGCYVNQLGAAYLPYVERTTKVLAPLVSERSCEELRMFAADALPALCDVVIKGVPDPNEQRRVLQEMIPMMMYELIAIGTREADLENLEGILHNMFEVIKRAGKSFFTEQQLLEIAAFTKTMMHESEVRRQKRDALKAEEDYDEELHDDVIDETEQEFDLMGEIAEYVSVLLQNQPDFLVPFQQLSAPFSNMLQPHRPARDHQVSLCVFCDVIEHGGAQTVPLIPQLLPVMITYATDADCHVRQAACYAIGQCARFGGQEFAPFHQSAVEALTKAYQAPRRGEEPVVEAIAADNAVAAMGRICEFQSAVTNITPVMAIWVQMLPVMNDTVEGKQQHAFLCTLIEQGNAVVLGQNNANLPHLVKVLATCLGTESSDEATNARCCQILKQMRTSLPAELLQHAWGALPEDLRAKLQNIT
eukprot:gnl/Trimastix_PCT/676.p1 GENE.gnl/Trimastix_PCT/676~~gnl/Trimastix_PCT/676.p1  ORF type:complete len:1087 (+),score=395.79 gnl/Trimastix_PCT/676:74-3334(+)